MNNNEAIKLLQDAADWGDAMLEMAEIAPTYARAIVKLLKEQEPVVHCKGCVKRDYDNCPFNEFSMYIPEDNFYCGEGA